MTDFTIEEINEKILISPESFISQCEERYNESLRSVARKILCYKGRTLVMLAGPSSSGKTTTASIICRLIKESGRNAAMVSLDDFYKDQTNAPRFPDGRPDFETVHALDIEKITCCLSLLLKTGRADMPVFDFTERKPKEETVVLEIGESDVVIVEGLHALNPLITGPLENENMLKLYVSVSSRIYNGEKVVFSKRDIRQIQQIQVQQLQQIQRIQVRQQLRLILPVMQSLTINLYLKMAS